MGAIMSVISFVVNIGATLAYTANQIMHTILPFL